MGFGSCKFCHMRAESEHAPLAFTAQMESAEKDARNEKKKFRLHRPV